MEENFNEEEENLVEEMEEETTLAIPLDKSLRSMFRCPFEHRYLTGQWHGH